ncbi:MAG: BolA/IbaG family iron-sulfur metabolism protein [Proteobacteria bacterium]|nr:BolA/IbaG family iron-sulfur metabolism protein [Pseudomonadota bacterium]
MPMSADEIKRLIMVALPDSIVSIEDQKGGGDHYACHVQSKAFRGKTRLEQHKMVYDALGEHIGSRLHALTLQTTAIEE